MNYIGIIFLFPYLLDKEINCWKSFAFNREYTLNIMDKTWYKYYPMNPNYLPNYRNLLIHIFTSTAALKFLKFYKNSTFELF